MIVFYLPNLRSGGAERVMVNLINYYFENETFELCLLLGKREGKLLDQLPNNLTIYTLHAGSAKRSVVPLIRFCNQHQPTAIFATLGASWAMALAKPFISKQIKVINRLGNTIGAEKLLYSNKIKRWMYIFANKLIGKASDLLIFQCNYMAEDYLRETGIHVKQYAVIYNPVNVSQIQQLALAPTPQSYDLLAVGRLDPQKDYVNLINACRLLKEKGVAFTIGILGDGKLLDTLSALVQANDLSAHVYLLGYLKNPYSYISKSKFLVSSSLYEGFSNVIIESLCLGTPVIATDCPGGNKETIYADNGYLCELGNSIALADTMATALMEQRRFNPLDISNEAISRYSLPMIAKQYGGVLNEIIT